MTNANDFQTQIEQKFLESLRHHLSGLRSKVENDFSKVSFEYELNELRRDPVYSKFAFDSPEYVLVRLMGRMSISIGRRLGEIYDKIPRFVAAERFGLSPDQVAPKLHELELDIGLRFSDLTYEDIVHVKKTVNQYLQFAKSSNGVGIEIRYNFNPNDSARLRKDVTMADYVKADGLLPIYLIFSVISPRDEAITRLQRAGWNFLVGESAISFARELFGLDLTQILDKPNIKTDIQKKVSEIMQAIISSYAFQVVIAKHQE